METRDRVRCGNAWHTVVWRDGSLSFPDHPDIRELEREMTLADLNGKSPGCRCADVLQFFRRPDFWFGTLPNQMKKLRSYWFHYLDLAPAAVEPDNFTTICRLQRRRRRNFKPVPIPMKISTDVDFCEELVRQLESRQLLVLVKNTGDIRVALHGSGEIASVRTISIRGFTLDLAVNTESGPQSKDRIVSVVLSHRTSASRAVAGLTDAIEATVIANELRRAYAKRPKPWVGAARIAADKFARLMELVRADAKLEVDLGNRDILGSELRIHIEGHPLNQVLYEAVVEFYEKLAKIGTRAHAYLEHKAAIGGI